MLSYWPFFLFWISFLSPVYSKQCIQCPCQGAKCVVAPETKCDYLGGECDCVYNPSVKRNLTTCNYNPLNLCSAKKKISSSLSVCEDPKFCHSSCSSCFSHCAKNDPNCCTSCPPSFTPYNKHQLGPITIHGCQEHIPLEKVCPLSDAIRNTEKARWVYLIYFHGDNDLEDFVFLDLKELLQLSQTSIDDVVTGELRIIAIYDRLTKPLNMPTFFSPPIVADCREAERKKKTTATLGYQWEASSAPILLELVAVPMESETKLVFSVVESWDEVDMASARTLHDFIVWAMNRVNSLDRLGLFLWNHGLSFLGYGGDDTSKSRLLSLPPMLNAVTDALDFVDIEKKRQQYFDFDTSTSSSVRLPKPYPLDLLAYDACLMGGLTVLELTSRIAEVIIASEDLIPAISLPYQALLSRDPANPKETISPSRMGYLLVKKHSEVSIYKPHILSAWNSSGIQKILRRFNDVIDGLFQCGGLSDVPATLLINARNKAKKVPNCETLCGSCLDFSSFLVNLLKEVATYSQTFFPRKVGQQVEGGKAEALQKRGEMRAEKESPVGLEGGLSIKASFLFVRDLIYATLLDMSSVNTLIARTNKEFITGQEGFHIFLPSVLEMVRPNRDRVCFQVMKIFKVLFGDNTIEGRIMKLLGYHDGYSSTGGMCRLTAKSNHLTKSFLLTDSDASVVKNERDASVRFAALYGERRRLAVEKETENLNDVRASDMKETQETGEVNGGSNGSTKEPRSEESERVIVESTGRAVGERLNIPRIKGYVYVRTFAYYENLSNLNYLMNETRATVKPESSEAKNSKNNPLPLVYHLIGDTHRGRLLMVAKNYAEEVSKGEYRDGWNGNSYEYFDSTCTEEVYEDRKNCYPPMIIYIENGGILNQNTILVPGLVFGSKYCDTYACLAYLLPSGRGDITSIVFEDTTMCTMTERKELDDLFFSPWSRTAPVGSTGKIPPGDILPTILPSVQIKNLVIRRFNLFDRINPALATLAFVSQDVGVSFLTPTENVPPAVPLTSFPESVPSSSSSSSSIDIKVICSTNSETHLGRELDALFFDEWQRRYSQEGKLRQHMKHRSELYDLLYSNAVDTTLSLSASLGFRIDREHFYIEKLFIIPNEQAESAIAEQMTESVASMYEVEQCSVSESRGECDRSCEKLLMCPGKYKKEESEEEINITYSPPFIGDETCDSPMLKDRSIEEVLSLLENSRGTIDATYLLRCLDRGSDWDRYLMCGMNEIEECDAALGTCIENPFFVRNARFCQCRGMGDKLVTGDGKRCYDNNAKEERRVVVIVFDKIFASNADLVGLLLGLDTSLKKQIEGFALPQARRKGDVEEVRHRVAGGGYKDVLKDLEKKMDKGGCVELRDIRRIGKGTELEIALTDNCSGQSSTALLRLKYAFDLDIRDKTKWGRSALFGSRYNHFLRNAVIHVV